MLTSNYRFYGNINSQLIRYFQVNTSKYQTDRIVIGKTGLENLQAMEYFHPYYSMVFKHDLPTDQELKELVDKLKDYSQVLVYYSQFKSVLVQKPTIVDITELPTSTKQEPIRVDFILEPEIAQIYNFFDSQIKLLLLDQSFLESELARTASRLLNMDQAQTNANKYIEEQNRMLSGARRSLANTRILDAISHVFQGGGTSKVARIEAISSLMNMK